MRRLRDFIERHSITGLLGGVVIGALLAAIFAPGFPDWTGFAADPLPPGAAATPVVMYDQDKDLWDWLQLLLVPLVLAVGGYWLTRTENRYALELQERREKEAQRLEDQRIQEARRIEEERLKEAQRIEEERVRDAVLQAYFDQMTTLLLDKGLRTSGPEHEVRSVVRARTLTVLQQLDGERKARVVQFLYEAKLIGASEGGDVIVRLTGADLSKANLGGANLEGANLTRANLYGADLAGVNLGGAHLERAHLERANLYGANLSEANLERAHLEEASLEQAHLGGANLLGAYLEGASLGGVNLLVAHLEGASLGGVNLEGAYLIGASLRSADLRGASLRSADLRGADLRGADLKRADLEGADLGGADLGGADLEGANLQRVRGTPKDIDPDASHLLALLNDTTFPEPSRRASGRHNEVGVTEEEG